MTLACREDGTTILVPRNTRPSFDVDSSLRQFLKRLISLVCYVVAFHFPVLILSLTSHNKGSSAVAYTSYAIDTASGLLESYTK